MSKKAVVAREEALRVLEEMGQASIDHGEEFNQMLENGKNTACTILATMALEEPALLRVYKEITLLSQAILTLGYCIGKGYVKFGGKEG